MDWGKWERWANKTIPEPSKGVELQKAKYNLDDIARQCDATFKAKRDELKEFSKAFPPTLEGLRTLFDFCYHFFEYEPDTATDEAGKEISMQALQSPAVLWKYRVGDCKSYTVFIQSVIYHIGLPGEMYMVDYGHPTDKHIYPNAILNGKRVPLDVVYKIQQGGRFATEKKPYTMLKKIKQRGLYTVGTTAQTVTPEDMEVFAKNLNNRFSAPIQGPDITTMTEGEMERWQYAQRLKAYEKHETDLNKKKVLNAAANAVLNASVSGIGEIANTPFGKELAKFIQKTSRETAPAFQNPTFSLPPIEGATASGFGDWVKKQTKKVVDVVKDVANAVANAIKSLANVFHKKDAKVAAPFFLFAFLPAAALLKAKPEVKKRHANQVKMLDYLEKKGKMGSKSQILASMATGVKEKYGVMPQEILQAATVKKVGIVPLAATAATTIASDPKAMTAALGVLKGIVGAIISIFKKKDKEEEEFEYLSDTSYSDLSLLADTQMPDEDYANSGINPGSITNPVTPSKSLPNNGGGGGSDGSGGGSNIGLWLGGAALALAVVVGGKKSKE